jgi:hypothetical protein
MTRDELWPGFRTSAFSHRLFALALAGVLSIALAGASATRASAAGWDRHDDRDRVICRQDMRVPVAIAAGQPATYTVSGELCSSDAERHDGRTVQLLVPGATYDHRYWDFGPSTEPGTRTRAGPPRWAIRRSRSTCRAPATALRRREGRAAEGSGVRRGAEQIHACVVPGSGHDISLALNNRLQVADAADWSNSSVGTGRGRRDSDRLPRNCG